MPRKSLRATLLAMLIVSIASTGRAQDISSARVKEAIVNATRFLKSQQKAEGNWPEHPGQPGGLTGLCLLALLNGGEDPKSDNVARALKFMRDLPRPKMTYAVAVQTMAFCAADPQRDRLLIRRNAKWLISAQAKEGAGAGAWGYGLGSGRVDNSNSQFALLALHEAERVGVEIDASVWRLAHEYWVAAQNPDGSWAYLQSVPPQQPTGSMTCAGAACLIITSGKIRGGDAVVAGGKVQCCQPHTDDANLDRALNWLGRKFSVDQNPGSSQYLLYYMYGIERVGRLSGRRFLGSHDWYRAGANKLLNNQNRLSHYWRGTGYHESNPVLATALSVLFLSKGLRPVVIARLKHESAADWDPDNWSLHRAGLHHMTKRVENRWKRDLTWQTIDMRSASVNDLLQTPVLFISGRDGLRLSDQQVKRLRAYVDQGGFIFAEAACSGDAFDADFRNVIKRMFPESSLRLLPPDHPVWYAEQRVDPKYLPHIYGVDACCRTSVVYVPRDLSCYWELAREGRTTGYPKDVQDEIEACLRIGSNVVAYATNRELKDKLDRPQMTIRERGERLERGTLYIPKLNHGGGANDAPNALNNLMSVLHDEVRMRVNTESQLISATDDALFDYPMLFMHGRRNFRFNAAERKSLVRYLERGGLLFADSICGGPQFTAAFRREIAALFPDKRMQRIPIEHALLTNQYKGYDLSTVTLRDPKARGEGDRLESKLIKTTPLLEGLEIDGRLAVIFSPYDITCALENSESLECKGYIRQDAARIGVNVVLFALQQ